jgi:prepilin signal peptidase PulO-like enzyme (type II secretory pathway)
VTLGYALQFPLAGALMFVIYITLVLIFKTGIGGADTKVSSIMALHLGLANGALLVFTHFIAAMIYAAYMSIVKHKRIASVPLMVFIAIGFAITMIIKWSAILL